MDRTSGAVVRKDCEFIREPKPKTVFVSIGLYNSNKQFRQQTVIFKKEAVYSRKVTINGITIHMKKMNQSGFHLWIVPLLILVIGFIGFAAMRVGKSDGPKDEGGSGQQKGNTLSFADQYKDTCKDRSVDFTSPPLKMQDLGYIRPLGAMLDGHVTPTDHVYVGPVNRNVADNTYPVLMPANGTVVDISRMPDQYIGDRSGTQLAPEDHRIVVSFSCRYYAIFIHIHKLAGKLATETQGLQPNESKKVSIDLKAGDTIGYIGGDTFDWTPVDTSKKLSGFISPKLYMGESWKINTVSPFDLYKGSLKMQLEAKSLRTAAPIGGKIDYDKPGKLIGSWFRQGTNGYSGSDQQRYWDGHLSIVPDYIDPSYTIVSIGNWQDKAGQFVVKGTVDPAKISAKDGMVKMELAKLNYVSDPGAAQMGSGYSKGMHPDPNAPVVGTIAFQVESGEKLKVEKFVGKTPAQVTGFTSAAQTYER